jgi:hypothetical protein
MVTPKPDNMPITTAGLCTRGHSMPKTMPGKKADAAKEKEAETKAKISAGLNAATTAATMATANRANLDKITLPSEDWGPLPALGRMSRTKALLMVKSNPSAVESAAAKPPAATNPETTNGIPPNSGVANMIMSAPNFNSPNCKMPSALTSEKDNNSESIRDHCAIQLGSVSKLLPTKLLSTSNFTKTAKAGTLR